MSGHAAPTVLTPINIDLPFGKDTNGDPVFPDMQFAQMIQRILSFLGQPVGSGSAGGSSLSISEQIALLTTTVTQLAGQLNPGLPGLAGRVAALEAAIAATKPWPPASPQPFRLVVAPPSATAVSLPDLPPFPVEGLAPRADQPISPYPRIETPAVPPPMPAPLPPVWVPAAPASPVTTSVPLSWTPGINPNNLVVFTAPVAMIVKGIAGRLEVAEGAAATLSIVKAASGTALSAGTALHSGSFNANGSAATNQTLALSATLADIALAPGDSIGAQTTGAWTVSTGALTIQLST